MSKRSKARGSGSDSDSDSSEVKEILVEDTKKSESSEQPTRYTTAEKRKLQWLETYLEEGDPFLRGGDQKTLLSCACGFAQQKMALKMANAILAKFEEVQAKTKDKKTIKRYVDSQDDNGDTALHIAARIGHPEVVRLLGGHGADFNIRNKENVEPIALIYEKVPKIMTSAYDASVRCKTGNASDLNLTLTFWFGAICGVEEPEPNKPLVFKPETEWLSNCVKLSLKKQKLILTHPVVKLFLYLKGRKIRVPLWFSFAYHILWLTFFTYFNVNYCLVLCPYHNQTMRNSTPINITCKAGNQYPRLIVEAFVLLLMTIFVAIKEVYEFHSRDFKTYIKQPENIGHWLVTGFVILTFIPIIVADKEEMDIPDGQYQMSAVGILLACFLCLIQIGKIPKFGIYMLILTKVVKRFVMCIITFAAILVAFMLSFQILMPQKNEFNDHPWSFIRLLSMMSGEINYDSLFHGETDDELPFPNSTKLFFAAFIAIVTMILCNLLLGLTVSDIKSLQKEAEVHSLAIQVDGIHLLESFFLSNIMQALLRKFGIHLWLRKFLVTQQYGDPKKDCIVDVHIDDIPKEIKWKLKILAAENISYHSDDSDDDIDDGHGDESKSNKNSCCTRIKKTFFSCV